MRIAQIAPLWETVPPRSYGGTELVIHLLTEQFLKWGHEVTLFATGNSTTRARLESINDKPLREWIQMLPAHLKDQNVSLYPGSPASICYELQLLDKVFSQADQFDVIHNHLGYIALPFSNLVETPVITTLHGPFRESSIQEYSEKKMFEAFNQLPLVSISNYQRRPCPDLNYVATVYHGLDVEQYPPSFTYTDKNYLAFLGRFSQDKGPHLAIQIAKATGKKLLLAGKVDCQEEKLFFRKEIEPHLDGEQIQYIGELNHAQKVNLLQHAAATLCPVLWPEPFGLVLIESLACGTPVLALRNGSIPEIIAHGQTGFICDTVDEMISAVNRIPEIDRRICRHHVEERFSSQRMARDYLALYDSLIQPVTETSSLSRSGTSSFRP